MAFLSFSFLICTYDLFACCFGDITLRDRSGNGFNVVLRFLSFFLMSGLTSRLLYEPRVYAIVSSFRKVR